MLMSRVRSIHSQPAEESPAIELEQIDAGYIAGAAGCAARVHVLRGLSLCVQPGETVFVRAAPGAGLTSLLLCAAGLLRPWSGYVRADGRAPADALSRGSLAFVPTFPSKDRSCGHANWPLALSTALARRPKIVLLDPPSRPPMGADISRVLAEILAARRDGTTLLVAATSWMSRDGMDGRLLWLVNGDFAPAMHDSDAARQRGRERQRVAESHKSTPTAKQMYDARREPAGRLQR